MADKFYDGMPNVNDKLNEMDRAFAAGPYNALPLTGGTLSGPVSSSSSIFANGNIQTGATVVARICAIGPVGASAVNSIAGLEQVQGKINLLLSTTGTFYVSAGSVGNAAPCALLLSNNTTTGRSINAGGTINASGADYAEYLIKAPRCDTIAPGQLIGIDVLGQLTDHWDHAIAFAVKSTDPCMVGGDSWARHLGNRPDPVERILPTETVPGESDEEWAARQAPGLAFDAALETARQTVDRIAFSGQVPCNVQGANPGQYIVPVQAGDGIVGVAVSEDDLTFKQYLRAIGKVIAIEDDGRARIIVKVA